MNQRSGSLVVAAETALVALTMAVVLGLARLFEGGGWLGPIALNALAAHGLVIAARRRGLSLVVTGLLAAAGAVLVITWTSLGETMTIGLPSGLTWTTLGSELDLAWSMYQEVSAPAPAMTGFVVACSAAVWLIAYVADWAAFRVWVPFEATLPAGTLFLFTAMLGTADGRGWSVLSFAATTLGFLFLHRMVRQDGASHWVAERREVGQRSLLLAGAAVGTVAVLAGTALGPELPGADRPGLYDPTEQGGRPSSSTVNPLVSIRGQLDEQSSLEMFRVRSTQPAYWRLTALEDFDGETWTSSNTYREDTGELPVSVEVGGATEVVEQHFTIVNLAAIWMPSAFLPRAFESDSDASARFHPESATLIAERGAESSAGLVYDVTSVSPRLTEADLTDDATDVPSDIADTHLSLPGSFSPRVQALAEEVVAGAATPYEQARRLQDHLRQFAYDLEGVQPGHGEEALEVFLFERQRGYCEQFAGAYAAMARSIGLPARVAVGFTPGEEDPAAPGTYVVRGYHAHAWPEVYFAGAGWVAFEPTPGRGQPFTESYTGVPAAQAAGGDSASTETLPPTTAPSQIPTDTTAPLGGRPTQDDLETIGGAAPGGGGPAGEDPWLVRYIVRPLLVALAVVAGLITAYLVLAPVVLLARRARRRRRATTPDRRIAVAWAEAGEAAQPLGYVERRSDTPHERGGRLGALLPAPAEAASVELADLLASSVYGPTGADEDDAQQAEAASATVRASCRELAPLRSRVAHWLDPRRELRAWRQDRSARHRHITAPVRDRSDSESERELQPLG